MSMDDWPLGKKTEYVNQYDPSLLVAIPRALNRVALSIHDEALPFQGVDIWNAYEVSWLNAKGKPEVAYGEFRMSCSTPNIIESKSFKLYLNSFNQTRFAHWHEVVKTLESDLSRVAGGPVMVSLLPLIQLQQAGMGQLLGQNIDHHDVEITAYTPDANLLRVDDGAHIKETLVSHLLKSNCPVTGQPDWGSVAVSYVGQPINAQSLLAYVISFREHNEFHEHCVERMFVDISRVCQPQQLTVYARYVRRGGLDINPFRTNAHEPVENIRLARQ